MINIQSEINKLNRFNNDHVKIVRKFCLFIKSDKLSFSVSGINIVFETEKNKENSFKFPCKRKNLLRFIHPDRISKLNLEHEQENIINQCVIKIISCSFNIIESLKLIKESSNEDTFMLICNKLKLKKDDIDKITIKLDDSLPTIPKLLKEYIELERETTSLKSKITNIIHGIINNFKMKISEIWIDIYTKYFKCKYISNDESSQMERENYYVEFQIYKYYENNGMSITYGELITMLNKSSIIEKFNLMHVNTPYLYDYFYNLKVNSYFYDPSSIQTIAGLEFNRFLSS